MRHLGTVKPGSTVYIYFDTYDGGTGASLTMTGLLASDIEIYKDGSATTRASDTGYTLLDTDGIDFASTTGIHGISIDLSSNADAGFFEAGSHYVVVIASITVDAQTVNFVAADFTIGYPGAILDTTIAGLTSQTLFTLEDGSADNDAYNGCVAYVHDLASAIQVAIGYVSDYVGSTKSVTLAADPGIFTMAAGDNISLFPPSQVGSWNNVALATTNPLPNAAPDSSGGLATEDASGHLAVDVREWLGTAVTTSSTSAKPQVDVDSIDDDAAAADNLEAEYDGTGFKSYVRRNTAQAGAAGSITLDAGASATNSLYNGLSVSIISGTGVGQTRLINGYTGATKVATVLPSWTTNPSSDSVFVLHPAHVNVASWRLGQPNVLVSSRVDASVGAMAANVLTATAINADAITAAKIAADAIGASELATDAVNEIRDAILSDSSPFAGATIAAIETDTQDIQARLPAALVSGKMDSDATSISGDATAADRLEGLMDGVIVAQVNDASATTTAFAADGFTEATDDHFNGRLITFITGALAGQQTDITDYDALGHAQGSQAFVVTALTEAPANDDFFVIH